MSKLRLPVQKSCIRWGLHNGLGITLGTLLLVFSCAKTEGVAATLAERLTTADSIALNQLSDSLTKVGGEAARSLGGVLDSDRSSAIVKIRALDILRQMGEAAEPALPSLKRLLAAKSGDGQSSRLLFEVVSNLGARACDLLPELEGLLEKSAKSGSRLALVRAVGQLGGCAQPCVAPLWQIALRDPDDITRIEAGHSISSIGEKAVGFLLGQCNKYRHSEYELDQAGRILERMHIRTSAGTQLFLDIAQDITISGRVRSQFIIVLGNQSQPTSETIQDVGRLLNSNDAEVRAAGKYAMVEYGPKAIPVLLSCIVAGPGDDVAKVVAIEALGEMGEAANSAVEVLCELLKSDMSDTAHVDRIEGDGAYSRYAWEVRRETVRTMGEIGSAAGPCLASIFRVYRSHDVELRAIALLALAKIAERDMERFDYHNYEILRGYRDTIAIDVGQFDGPLNYSNRAMTEGFERLSRAVNVLETSRANRGSIAQKARDLVVNNPLWSILIAVYATFLTLLLFLFTVWPRCLISWFGWMGILNEQIPVSRGLTHSVLLTARFCMYSRRSLNAWLSQPAIIDRIERSFAGKATVRDRGVYLPQPIGVDSDYEDRATIEAMQRRFEGDSVCIFIKGDGGIGKTALACLLARWGLVRSSPLRLRRKHLLIPVLVEAKSVEDADAFELDVFVQRELESLCGSRRAASRELVFQLAKKGLLLLIIDGFSELASVLRTKLHVQQLRLPARYVLYTGRVLLGMGGFATHEISPKRLTGENLSGFIDSFLIANGTTDLLARELYAVCEKFLEMTHDQPVSVGLAKVYASTVAKAKANGTLTDLAVSVPDLITEYVDQLFAPADKAKCNQADLHEALRAMAWVCVRGSFVPEAATVGEVRSELKKLGLPVNCFDVLSKGDTLIEEVGLKRGFVRFKDDILAEYLGAMYIVKFNGNSVESWNSFLDGLPSNSDDCERIKSFLTATKSCCKAVNIEESVGGLVHKRLDSLLGTDRSEILRTEATARWYSLLANPAEGGERAMALQALSRLDPSLAVKTFLSSLNDPDFVVRHTAVAELTRLSGKYVLPHDEIVDLFCSPSVDVQVKADIGLLIENRLVLNGTDVNKIRPLAQSAVDSVREAVARVLKRTRMAALADAEKILRSLTADADPAVRLEAFRSLESMGKLGPKDIGGLYDLTFKDPYNYRILISESGNLTVRYDSSGNRLGWEALRLLQKIENVLSYLPVARLLSSNEPRDERHKLLIIVLFGTERSQRVREILARLVKDADEDIRNGAAYGLGTYAKENPAARKILEELTFREVAQIEVLREQFLGGKSDTWPSDFI